MIIKNIFVLIVILFCISCTKDKFDTQSTIDILNQATLPEVITSTSLTKRTSSIICSAMIPNDGLIAVRERGFCISTSAAPTINDIKIYNGQGSGNFSSQISDLEENITYYIRAYAINSKGIAYGNEVSFSISCNCPETVTDIDGNTYNVIKIGNQCWTTENLKTTRYQDGRYIQHESEYDEPDGISNDFYFVSYGLTDSADSYQYNWFAASHFRNIAPTNWHVPTVEEWEKMINKNGCPVLGATGQYWTATIHDEPTSANAWYYNMSADSSQISHNYASRTTAMFIRCIMD